MLLSNSQLAVKFDSRGGIEALHLMDPRTYRGLIDWKDEAPVSPLAFGVRIDGALSWLDDTENWKLQQTVQYPLAALRLIATNKKIGISLEVHGTVAHQAAAVWQRVQVVNRWDRPRRVQLVLRRHISFRQPQAYVQEEIILPRTKAKSERVASAFPLALHLSSHAAIAVSMATADSVQRQVKHKQQASYISLDIPAHSSKHVDVLLSVGTTGSNVLKIHNRVWKQGFTHHYQAVGQAWSEWSVPVARLFRGMTPPLRRIFLANAIAVRSHCFPVGVAEQHPATGDYYYSMRATAFALWPLLRLGHYAEVADVFTQIAATFTVRGGISIQTSDLFTDSTPLVKQSTSRKNHTYHEPLQPDVLANLIFLFAQLSRQMPAKRSIRPLYKKFLQPVMRSLGEYYEQFMIDDSSERSDVPSLYTHVVLYAACRAASGVAEQQKQREDTVAWEALADDIAATLEMDHQPVALAGCGFEAVYEQSLIFYALFTYGMLPSEDTYFKQQATHIGDALDELYQQWRNHPEGRPVDSRVALIHAWLAQYYAEQSDRALLTWHLQRLVRLQLETTWQRAELLSTLLDTVV